MGAAPHDRPYARAAASHGSLLRGHSGLPLGAARTRWGLLHLRHSRDRAGIDPTQSRYWRKTTATRLNVVRRLKSRAAARLRPPFRHPAPVIGCATDAGTCRNCKVAPRLSLVFVSRPLSCSEKSPQANSRFLFRKPEGWFLGMAAPLPRRDLGSHSFRVFRAR
jgi:hypothetical protein